MRPFNARRPMRKTAWPHPSQTIRFRPSPADLRSFEPGFTILHAPNMQAMPIPFIDPIDVSHLVAFLASDESRYITGLNIRVDAGAMLKTPPI